MAMYARPSYTGQAPSGAHWNPPFNGAPPIPQGLNVNQQDWSKGSWQFNKAFNPAASSSSYVPWIPSQQWPQQTTQAQQHQQQKAQVNPYQRPHKPPSASYLSMPVKENNALDLFGMVPKEELPSTPWIWNPRGLVEDDTDEGIIHADFRDAQGRQIGRESRGATPTRRRSTSQAPSPSPSPLRHQRHHSLVPPPARHSSEPAPASHRQIYAPSPVPTPIPSPTPTPTPGRRATEPAISTQQEFQNEALLRPTFNTSIVRTPEHYRDSASGKKSSRSTSTESPTKSSSSSRHRKRSSNGDADLVSKMQSMSTGLTRQHSLPNQIQMMEEPAPLLSPLMFPEASTSASLGSRPLGRHHTAPTLSAIPESTSHQQTIYTHVPPPRSLTSSPTSHPSSRHQSPNPPLSSSTSVSPQHYQLPTPPRDAPYGSSHTAYLHTPAPAPVRRESGKAVSAKTAESVQMRRRVGWWNNRGDHLTEQGKVVYAPPEVAYPPELRHYPKAGEGWKNDKHHVIKHENAWTELETSLPRLGRLPINPYHTFVVYTDQAIQSGHYRRSSDQPRR